MPVQEGISQEVYCHRYIYDSEVYHTTANIALTEVLNITGRGQVSICHRGVHASHFIRVTVDGNIIINNREIAGWSELGIFFLSLYNFNNSLVIEHRNNDGVTDVRVLLSYCVN